MPNIVDRFNVGGEDFYIEPAMDDVPTEGSQRTVKSGGVAQAIKDSDALQNDKFIATMLGTRMLTAAKVASVQPVSGGYLLRRGDLLFSVNATLSLNTSVSADGDIWHDTGVIFAVNNGIFGARDRRVAVCEHEGLYAAVTTNGIAYSINGIDWTVAYSMSVTTSQQCFVKYVGGVWFAFVAAVAYYSFNGQDWDICDGIPTDLANTTLVSVWYNNGVYVLINNSSDVTKNFYYSTDGSTWVAATGTHNKCFISEHIVFFRNGLWLVGCAGGVGCCWSEDGINWTQATLSEALPGSGTRLFGAFAYMESSGLYIATAYSVNYSSETVGMWYSSDGKAWSKATGTIPEGSSSSRGIFIYGAQAMVCAAGLFISDNGTVWYQSSITTPPSANIRYTDIGYLVDDMGKISCSPLHNFESYASGGFVMAANGNFVWRTNGGTVYNSVANMRSLGLLSF